MPHPLETKAQSSRSDSPWSFANKVKQQLWRFVWFVLFRPTLKPMTRWRLALLRWFGAKIPDRVFVSESARVNMPWHLEMERGATLAPHAEAYALGRIILRARCTVAQHVYLCTGTHDLSVPETPLMTGTIEIGPDAFIGARALILPGVIVGEGAVVGAGSVVTKDVEPWTIVAGNPARPIRKRVFNTGPETAGQDTAGPDTSRDTTQTTPSPEPPGDQPRAIPETRHAEAGHG